jgi:D-serine deaminase-like pyridoxal phosphate-dependent protein
LLAKASGCRRETSGRRDLLCLGLPDVGAVEEAEVLLPAFDGMFPDILMAYPVVDVGRAQRLASLAREATIRVRSIRQSPSRRSERLPTRHSGHGLIVEYPDAVITKLSEAHGQVDVARCGQRPRVGERVSVIPNHIRPCINLQDRRMPRSPIARDCRSPTARSARKASST